jgi:putative Holliday junction resolvase
MGAIMALDIGEVRVGIAVSDVQRTVAMPVKVLPAAEVTSEAKSFKRLLEDYQPDLLVCGLPKSLDGAESVQAERVREVAGALAQKTGLELEYYDERLSSLEAKRILHTQGLSEKEMRGRVDAVAASLVLQGYLDANREI